MPPVKVFYHDGPHATDPDLYHVPGMENETILPPANNLADKGRATGGRGGGSGTRSGGCPSGRGAGCALPGLARAPAAPECRCSANP